MIDYIDSYAYKITLEFNGGKYMMKRIAAILIVILLLIVGGVLFLLPKTTVVKVAPVESVEKVESAPLTGSQPLQSSAAQHSSIPFQTAMPLQYIHPWGDMSGMPMDLSGLQWFDGTTFEWYTGWDIIPSLPKVMASNPSASTLESLVQYVTESAPNTPINTETYPPLPGGGQLPPPIFNPSGPSYQSQN